MNNQSNIFVYFDFVIEVNLGFGAGMLSDLNFKTKDNKYYTMLEKFTLKHKMPC